MVECSEKKQDHAGTLLDAIRCIEKVWRRVTDRNIQNCFRHAGILSAQGVKVTENEDDVEVEAATAAAADDDDLPLSEWVRKIYCDVLGHYEYDAYATIDNDIVTTKARTDEDIVREVRHKNGKLDPEQEEEDKEEEEEEVEVPTPRVSEALEAIRVVNRFYEARAGNSRIVSQIMGIEGHLENECWATCRRQMRIMDYSKLN
jgi:hypothetical protein